MAGCDDHGPQLYQIDPSGSYFAWKASAIGKNMTNAKTFLEKRYSEVSRVLACKEHCIGLLLCISHIPHLLRFLMTQSKRGHSPRRGTYYSIIA